MPTEADVEMAKAATPEGNDTYDNSGDEAQPSEQPYDAEPEEEAIVGIGSSNAPEEDEEENYMHLADAFKEPLHTYPYCDPSPNMKAAYITQKAAKKKLDAARKDRSDFELNVYEDVLAKLQNALRESKERELAARREVRNKTLEMYDVELTENTDKNKSEFNQYVSKIKAYVRNNKGLPPSLEELDSGADELTDARYIATWIHNLQQDIINGTSTLEPHELSMLEFLGIAVPLTEDDEWQRSYLRFQVYSKEYWDSPIRIQNTNGDVVKSIMEFSTDKDRLALQTWCMAQQERFEADAFEDKKEWYTKLVDAGFTFDAIVDDEKWAEDIEMIVDFRNKFGHVHIQENYVPQNFMNGSNIGASNYGDKASKLRELISKVRMLVHRDALSPKRVSSLKKAKLYLDLGGRVYANHVKYCNAGREQRAKDEFEEKMKDKMDEDNDNEEEENEDAPKTAPSGKRIKRKFAALAAVERANERIKKKHVVTRGNMDLWTKKLEKLVEWKKVHGNVDIQNDVKLKRWTYSIIRKLAINSNALKGQKMALIEKEEGLKEFLLQKENVETATKFLKDYKAGVYSKRGRGGNSPVKDDGDEGEENNFETNTVAVPKVGLEELTEDVLLGNKEDHEVNAFMQTSQV